MSFFGQKIDIFRAFYQTPLEKESRRYTASSLPGCGFWQYTRSPLGLASSPCYFQSLVEKMFMGLKQKECVVYLDDLLSAHATFEARAMLANLSKIFQRVRESKMLLSAKKCSLFQQKLKFLGVVLSRKGIEVCPEKVVAINNMLRPKNVKGVRSFLGVTGFFRRFIRGYSAIAEPLTRLTKKGEKFHVVNAQELLEMAHIVLNVSNGITGTVLT